MSKYIKLEDAIEAYNQAVTLLVESEMEEFNLGDFTECSFNTTQIKLIARMIESLPTIEVSEDAISRATLCEKIKSLCHETDKGCGDCHKACDIEDCLDFVMDAPSVVPKEKEGEWFIREYEYFTCDQCGEDVKSFAESTQEAKTMLENGDFPNYCPNCGVRMRGTDDE